MAIIRPIHGQMSGSLGGNTWSRNRGGAYLRIRSTPVNPTSTRQQRARSLLATYSGDWRTLAVVYRTMWNEWAALHPVQNALGETVVLSGHQAFVGLSSRAFLAFGSAPITPPVLSVPDALEVFTLGATQAVRTLVMTYSPNAAVTGKRLMCWECIPQSGGRSPTRRQARFVAVSTTSKTTPWLEVSRFAPGIDEWATVFLAVVQPDGQVSPPLRARAVWAG